MQKDNWKKVLYYIFLSVVSLIVVLVENSKYHLLSYMKSGNIVLESLEF